jgi:predicted dinucleotide-binding enzyme
VDKVIELAGPSNLAGKTVIDTTNPIADAPPVNGVLPYTTGPNESLGEKIQAMLPQSHVVKAFNSVGNARMVNPQFEQGTPTMFLCGDNDGAKAQVSEIVRQFGWEPFDCGGIIAARALEPLCMLWCIPGFVRNQWTHAFKVLTHRSVVQLLLLYKRKDVVVVDRALREKTVHRALLIAENLKNALQL